MPVSPTNKPRNKKPPTVSATAKAKAEKKKRVAKIRLLSKKRTT